MRKKKFSTGWMALLAILTATLATGTPAAAQHETILYNFGGSTQDALDPSSALIFDAVGNLYGTTQFGGAYGYGAVFELMPQAGGGWSEKVLYSFDAFGKDAYFPLGGLIFGISGNLYGTTYAGGTHGTGTVFELVPQADGSWTEKTLHSFKTYSRDGWGPGASLMADGSGNLYGTTAYGGDQSCAGGPSGCGEVFELLPQAGGGWTEQVLHTFSEQGTEGNHPCASLAADGSGNLYGTTERGGGGICSDGLFVGCGVVFELLPQGGVWTERVLHTFNDGADGGTPVAGLTIDAAGNLYGVTEVGGAGGGGIVFELTPTPGKGWREKILHNFNVSGAGGDNPRASLIFDAAGNLYGTTAQGGSASCALGCGVVFELMPKAGGGWTEKVLHTFSNSSTDGATPTASLILDTAGNLYGVTTLGGAYGGGTVFEIIP